MKTLYNLVKFKNELSSKLQEISLRSEIDNKINLLDGLIQTNEEFPYSAKIEEIKNSYNYLLEINQQKIDALIVFIDQLADEIENLGLNEFSADSFVEESINSQLTLDDTTKNIILSKISQYSSARYPGMQILARERQWIVPMVACDPLYLTRNKMPDSFYPTDDPDMPFVQYYQNLYPEGENELFIVKPKSELRLLEELIAEYPESYQRRVGLYTISDRDFSILPQNQFGFVLCWDNFDYLTCTIVQKYLQEVFRVLRPGGVFMFSYTNCEMSLSALKVDYQAAAYCSSTWLSKVLVDIGYEIVNLVDYTSTIHDPDLGVQQHPISWAEVRKPGQLTTVKRAQAQGLIGRK